MGIYEELEERGLIAKVTNKSVLKDLINSGKAVFYFGIDPTVDSLHIGHFVALCIINRLQSVGNKPIIVMGGATGKIGDSSGKLEMRNNMDDSTINYNIACLKEQMSKFINFDNNALILNNADWLLSNNYIDFLLEFGEYFSINKMKNIDYYNRRLENNLSFYEFSYIVMQSFDFYTLFSKYGCNFQLSGIDNWSSALAGINLIKKKCSGNANAMTFNILTSSNGEKMGKMKKGTIWLNPEKTSPNDFYNYWLSIDDSDVIKCMKYFTNIPLEHIYEYERNNVDSKKLKEILAFQLTQLVHGTENTTSGRSKESAK